MLTETMQQPPIRFDTAQWRDRVTMRRPDPRLGWTFAGRPVVSLRDFQRIALPVDLNMRGKQS